jgi:hypothetical protein
MQFKGMWSRWHRFDDQGVKQIKKFGTDETPNPLVEPGYTEWKRGTGPMSPEQYVNVTTAVKKACIGVPKTEEQKQKMRMAKLGVPKSEEHKKNMKLTWQKKRQERYQEAMKQLRQGNG